MQIHIDNEITISANTLSTLTFLRDALNFMIKIYTYD